MDTSEKADFIQLSKNEVIRRLYSLNKELAFILYQRLNRRKLDAIASMLGIAERTVEEYSSSLNDTFHAKKRNRDDLAQKTYYLMDKYVPKETTWSEWNWPTQNLEDDFLKLPPEPDIKGLEEKAKEKSEAPTEEKKEEPQIKPKDGKPAEEAPYPVEGTPFELKPENITDQGSWQEIIKEIALNRTYQIIAFGVLVFLIFVFIVTRGTPPQFSPSNTPGNTVAALVNTETPTVTLTSTPEPTATIIPTYASTLTSAPTSTPEPTETPTNTSTPEPTFTPTVTPTPEDILLSDDFSKDFSNWKVYNPDKAFLADGQFVSGNFYGTWISTNIEAKNFKITVVTNGGATGTSGVIIAPAFVDPNNYFGFRTNFCDRDWRVNKNNRVQVLTNFDKQCFEKLTVEITVMGNNMDVQINGIEIGSALNNQISSGKLGLMADSYGKIDSVKVIRLP